MEENKRTAQEIRKEMADILGIPVRDDIENVYEHAIQYQLDDGYEKNRFAELRQELAAAIEREGKSEEQSDEQPDKPRRELTDSEKLQARIDAYEGGSTYEDELKIAENREEIVAILDKHGEKNEDGTLKVVPGEGGVVEAAYKDEVATMRKEIRDLAAKRTGKVSERGEDVLPTLKQLQAFLQTPEGKKEGAYAQEVARLIEENKKSLKNIEAYQKDSTRVQELKKEITEINEEIAKINAKVKEDPNYDAESIQRTRLSVTLFHRQNELRGILARNPNANESIDTSRATAKLENIISELEGIQKEQVLGQKGDDGKGDDGKGNDGKGDDGKGDDGKGDDGKGDDGKGNDGKGDDGKGDDGKGDDGKGDDGKDDDGKGGSGKDDDGKGGDGKGDSGKGDDGKDGSQGTETPEPTYTVGTVRGFFLSIVRKILSKVKPDGFLGKFFGGVESGLLIGAKKNPPKLTTVPEGSKVKTSTKEKVPEESEVDIGFEDSKWAMTQVSNVGNMDKKSLMVQIIKEAFDKSKEDRKDIPDDKLPEYLEREEIPVVFPGDEHAFNNILYSNVVGNVLDRAVKKGIPTTVREGKNEKDRPISEIYADLERKHLQEKTDAASKEAAAAKKAQDREGTPTPVSKNSQEAEK